MKEKTRGYFQSRSTEKSLRRDQIADWGKCTRMHPLFILAAIFPYPWAFPKPRVMTRRPEPRPAAARPRRLVHPLPHQQRGFMPYTQATLHIYLCTLFCRCLGNNIILPSVPSDQTLNILRSRWQNRSITTKS